MIKRIIEAPFHLVAWLFKDTYGRILSVLLLTALVCLVNYPLQDTEVGEWEVEYTLTEAFSKEEGAPDYVDETGRIDSTAIAVRKTIRRVGLLDQWAYVTLPFHHRAERRLEVLSEDWNESRKNKVVRMRVLVVSKGLNLGLDLRGGTEVVYRVVVPEDRAEEKLIRAQDAARIVRQRIDSHGLKEPRVQPMGEDRVLVQIPSVDTSEVARVKKIITQIGRLEFRLVADKEKHAHLFEEMEKTGTVPRGWHTYVLRQEDPKDPSRVKDEELLISDKMQLSGEEVDKVTVGIDSKSGTKIAVTLTFKQRDAFWQVTRENVGSRLAIIRDDVRDRDENLVKKGRVVSAPVIRGAIPGGAEVTGGFTQDSAEDMKIALQSGSLRTPLEQQSERFVGPYQGLQSIRDGRRAILIGFVAVVAFILIYYLKAGLVADFALLLNLLILVAALALRSATLTLPGIAGIMLTIGMSIDANVLIFERVREEIRKLADKPLLKCMRDGHRKALVTIFDANLTTLITGIILHEFGSGPVRGFAVTLCYGILISMFTAIVVTRVILEALLRSKMVKTLPMLQLVRSPKIPFVAMRRVFLTASIALVIAGVAYFFAGPGSRFGIEFSSGTLLELNLKEKVTADVVRTRVREAGYADAEVQELSAGPALRGARGSSRFAVRLRYVPTVAIKDAGRVDAAADPEFGGGARVAVETNRAVLPEDMVGRLAASGSPDCAVEATGTPVEGRFAYVVRNADPSPDAVRELEANVRAVFGSELVTGDIRKAFTEPSGESLLAAEGIREVSETDGRTTLRVALTEPVTPEEVRALFAGRVRPEPDVRPDGSPDGGKASVLLISASAETVPAVKAALRESQLGLLEPFSGIMKIYPSVARELTTKATVALVLALLAIVAYVWFRFEFRFGLAAVAALVHDVCITLGALALANVEISLTVIAGLLTIIGYSLNDTIVVFDRIRENRRTVRKTPFPDLVNLSINQTLARTILTSLTTLLAVVSLYVFGGTAIHDFAFTLLVGVVAGTYSSIFIASPILLMIGEQGALRGPLGTPSGRTARPLEGMRTA